ncbi:MAG: pyridoxamine 5'-phosphate oxidase family protein [Eubacteriales bacterium]
MNEILAFLKENPTQYLATVGLDGKAKCRPFMFLFEKEGKLWFCTNNQKDVYKEMKSNPNVEVTTSSPQFAWVRISGTATFVNNMEVKKGCMEIPMIQGIYQTAENPIFEVFYLADAKAILADFSGNPPKKLTL